MNQVQKKLRITKKTIKRATRRASTKFLAAAAVSAVLPYKLEKRRDLANGDDGYVLSSLLLRIDLVPRCEDSVENKTLLRIGLRPMKDVREDLHRWEETFRKYRNKPTVVEPAPLSEQDAKKLAKAEKRVTGLERRIMKKRMKEAKKALKESAKA